MNPKTETAANSWAASKLPHDASLNPEVLLKSSGLIFWEKEVLELFELALNEAFCVGILEKEWADAAELFREQYYPALIRLERLGERLFGARQGRGEAYLGSDEERAQFFKAIAQPLCSELADILKQARHFLPDMVQAASLMRWTKLLEGSDAVGNLVESESTEQWRKCLEALKQLEYQVRALGILREDEGKLVDLGALGQRLARTTMATGWTQSDIAISGVVVQAPTYVTEALMLVISHEMFLVAAEYRNILCRSLDGITVFDIKAGSLDLNKHQAESASLVTSSRFLDVTWNAAGRISIGIPVPREDFESLTWLKENVGHVMERWRYFVEQIGGTITTSVENHPQAPEYDHKEYSLHVQFKVPDEQAAPASFSRIFEFGRYSLIDDAWRGLVLPSLLQRTPKGHPYYMMLQSESFLHNELSIDKQIPSAIDSIVDTLETVDSVMLQVRVVHPNSSILFTDDDELSDEDNFEEGDENDAIDQHEVSDHDTRQTADCLFIFCDGRAGIQQMSTERLNSIQRTFRQLQEVASNGFKGARKIPYGPPRIVPFTRVTLSTQFLANSDLVQSFVEISSRYNIGEFNLPADTGRAKKYLTAVRQAVEAYLAESKTAERLTLQLDSQAFVRTPIGLMSSELGRLQIFSSSGGLLAEGIYSPIEGVFELTTIPQAIIQPLTEAIVEVIKEQLSQKRPLQLRALPDAIERRGFRIPDELVARLFLHVRSRNGITSDTEMMDDIRIFLQETFKVVKILPPVFEADICRIYAYDEILDVEPL